ncbi:hypothetical protein ACQCT3_13095 [Sutcliffiella horikoshii]
MSNQTKTIDPTASITHIIRIYIMIPATLVLKKFRKTAYCP